MKKTKYRIDGNKVRVGKSAITNCVDESACLNSIHVIEGRKLGAWYENINGVVYETVKDEKTNI